jgi:hypothetical protein
MKYPDLIEYITFLFFLLDEFSTTAEKVAKRGRPQTYPDASLIVFYAVMTLKGIPAMRAQQDYLFHHPLEDCILANKTQHYQDLRSTLAGEDCILANRTQHLGSHGKIA